jgi:RHS repeat-associated protein
VDELFGFNGRLFDKATGLQNNLGRWYDSRIERWISEDPEGLDASDPNLYCYAKNDPMAFEDFGETELLVTNIALGKRLLNTGWRLIVRCGG